MENASPPPRSPRVASPLADLGAHRKLKAIDLVGIVLAFAGMTVFILGLTWGGREYEWNSAHVIATLVVGSAVSVAFVAWQWKGPEYPLVPRESRSPPGCRAG